MSDTVKIMNSVKEALLSTTKIDVNRLFNGDKNIAFNFENENIEFNYSLTRSQTSTLLRLSIFHFLQFVEKGTLTEDNNYNCLIIIISILHIANDFESTKEIGFLKECANSIFKNSLVLQYFLPVYKKKNIVEEMFTDTFLKICETLCSFNHDFRNIDTILVYKDKFMNLLESCVEKSKNREKTKELVKGEFFRILPFSAMEMVKLIRIMMELPTDKFLSSNKTCLSVWGITVSNLIDGLEGNKFSGNVTPLDADLLRKLFSILSVLKPKVETITLEKSLREYLERFPQNIGDIDKRTIVSLVQNKIGTETVKLISLLVSRNSGDISQFLKIAKKHDSLMKNSDIVFPILGSNLKHSWDKQFLLKLYELHRDEIVKYFTEFSSGNSWIRENVAAVIYLIESTFDSETCRKICDSVLVSGDKLVNVDVEYLQLIDSCFRKIKMHQEFLQVLVHSLVSILKLSKSATSLLKNEKKLDFLCLKLLSTIETLRKDDEKFVYSELSKNHFWAQFVRFSLSQCLKFSDDKSRDNSLLFKAFIATCNIAYKDNSNEEYATTIFGLAASHSEYVNIMLSSSNIKRYLLELLLILIRKNKSIMSSQHIPLYLSAYNASLSECDQILLLILKEYETSNIDLSKYRPFLWGSAAASHYSVKTDLVNALWNQPKTSQILDLFVPEMVNNTIAKFPVYRSLKDDSLCAPENVYDPVFYLPVLCELLSIHNPVAYHRVTHSGALALMLIAVCSECEQIRLASFTVISRFYSHLENPDVRRSMESFLWVRFIDALRNGINELGIPMKEVRLNGFVATFLARASIVGTQPLHPLYWPLHKFFMARPALKLNGIPEFRKLFYSTEIDHEAHRSWILEVIRDGFRAENDLQILINSSMFNILLSFYVSSLSDKLTRKLILEIVNKVARFPKSASLLVNNYGIIPWLTTIADKFQSSDTNFLPLLTEIVKNFINSLEKTKVKDKFSLRIFLQFLEIQIV